MPRPCPDDLRMGVVEKVLAGESCNSVARKFRVVASSVIEWFQRYSKTGSAGPSRMGGCCRPKLEGRRIWIPERTKACLAINLAGLQGLLLERGVSASVAAIWRFLQSCGIARKKLTPVADERNRLDAERRRERWKRHQDKADPRKQIFIDETWTKTSMSPRCGCAPRDKGCTAGPLLPLEDLDIHCRSATRPDRRPWVLDGSVNGDVFLLLVETQLVPTLSRGDIAVMDNPGSHKTETVRAAV